MAESQAAAKTFQRKVIETPGCEVAVNEPDPELITIIEGPSPEFHPSPYLWLQSTLEGPEDYEVVMCELRTLKGASVVERCRAAWEEGRPVKLDYPDYMRLRQRLDVVALRLQNLDEGPLLYVWVRQPAGEYEEESPDEPDDDLGA
jgi:hypothetical protein